MNRSNVRAFGKALEKKKNWKSGLLVGGKTAQLAGSGVALVSPLFGPLAPEVALAGGAIGGIGKLSEKIGKSSLLK